MFLPPNKMYFQCFSFSFLFFSSLESTLSAQYYFGSRVISLLIMSNVCICSLYFKNKYLKIPLNYYSLFTGRTFPKTSTKKKGFLCSEESILFLSILLPSNINKFEHLKNVICCFDFSETLLVREKLYPWRN